MPASRAARWVLVCLAIALAPQAPAYDPAEKGIAELQADMQAGRTTSREIVAAFLARIAALDRAGPTLRSVIEVNPDALRIAEALDAERAQSGPRGPLHGIALLLKDNIDTADAMLTTAGSLALVDSHPAQDAFLIQRLRDAGAVILGKTNLSEWANFRSERSSSGWSARGGQTRNPYVLMRNPCGSSSGSGTAIAASLATAAIGTETDGSITCPAAVTGLVGFKPTVGLISRTGVVPISAEQDTAGPMARSVADAAVLLQALAAVDEADAATAALAARGTPDFIAALDARALQGAHIGVARNLTGFHEQVDAVFEEALDALRAAGAVILDPVTLPVPEVLHEDEFTALLFEFKHDINAYLAGRDGAARTLEALIAFNRAHAAQEMPYFGQELFLLAQEKGSLTEPEYRKARANAKRLAGAAGVDATLAKFDLDAIVAPTVGPAWTTDLINGDRGLGGGVSTPPAVAGYPHVTVPAGQVHGLPVGLSFIGAAWHDAELLGYAYDFELQRPARRPPAFLHRIDGD